MEDLFSYTSRADPREEDLQQDSDEDYEESIIEPKTLNELTALTDRTSPWSSMMSEPEHDPHTEQRAMEDVHSNGKFTLLSSLLQDDQNPNIARSCDSPPMTGEHPKLTETSGESTSIESLSRSDLGEEDGLRGEEPTLEVPQLSHDTSLSDSEADDSQELAMEQEEADREESQYPSSSSHPESSHRDRSSREVQSPEELPDVTGTTEIQHLNLLYPYFCPGMASPQELTF